MIITLSHLVVFCVSERTYTNEFKSNAGFQNIYYTTYLVDFLKFVASTYHCRFGGIHEIGQQVMR